jgi:hypothetical protein
MEIIGKINVVNGGKTIDKSETKSPQPQSLKYFVFTIAKFIFLEKRDLQLYYNIYEKKGVIHNSPNHIIPIISIDDTIHNT